MAGERRTRRAGGVSPLAPRGWKHALRVPAVILGLAILAACSGEQGREQGHSPAPAAPSETGGTTTARPTPPTAPAATPAPAEIPAPANPPAGTAPGSGTVAGSAKPPGGFEKAAPAEPRRSPPATEGRAIARWGSSGPSPDARSPWRPLAADGIHDPSSDAIGVLQEPRAALRGFPRDIAGNFVDWVAALRQGLIAPRARVGGGGQTEVLDTEVVFSDTRSMPVVIFPHRAHTEWLACRNCHDWLFKAERGANDISMAAIARGRACGLCHGKVAFPPTECFRCHNGPRPGGQ